MARAKIVERLEEYPYSSYKSYIFKRKEDLVYHDQILQMISKDNKTAPKRYRDFDKYLEYPEFITSYWNIWKKVQI